MKRFFLLLLAAIIGLLPLMSACAEAPLDGYPGIDELPAIDTINNPFEFFDVKNDPNGDGIVTDITEWEARRTEIRDLIQHYWLGYRWETASEDVSGKTRLSTRTTPRPTAASMEFGALASSTSATSSASCPLRCWKVK